MTKKMIEKVLESKPKNESLDLDKMLEKIYNGYLKGDSVSTKKTFSPSSIVYGNGKCPRYWYLAFDGDIVFEEKATPLEKANMENGTKSHERIEALLKNTGMLIRDGKEPLVYKDPPIFGYPDGVINFEGTPIVVEVKTTNSRAFEYRKMAGKPAVYHVEQLLIYMKVLENGTGVLLYENKDTNELLLMPVNVTQEYKDFIEYLFGWMKEVRKAWEDRKLPENPYRSNSSVCKKCPIQKACYAAPKGDIVIEPRRDLE